METQFTPRTKKKFARIVCYECRELTDGKDDGERFLTEEQYLKQLADANRGWRCPYCRCYPCEFDDEFFEQELTDV